MRFAEQDQAGAAIALPASVFRPSHPEVLPEDVEENRAWAPGERLLQVVEEKAWARHRPQA
jgi:hypothetical protein